MRSRFSWLWNGDRSGAEPTVDPGLASALGVLDPGTEDPSYWFRFRNSVLAGAAGELARRRRADVTIGDLVLSWSRTLVPATMLAAAVAAFLLVRSTPDTVVPLTVEEILAEGLAIGDSASERDVEVSFTSETF